MAELLHVAWRRGHAVDRRDTELAREALSVNQRLWLLHDQYAHFAFGMLAAVEGAPKQAENAFRSAQAVARRQRDRVALGWILAEQVRIIRGRKPRASSPKADRLADEALGIAAELDMAPLADRVRTLSLLSPREHTVLGHIAEGKADKEIAADLMISRHTVGNHVRHILRKLSVSSRTEAVTRARKLDLLRE
jgi:DNA-binding CsgD family transcriptional regulator